jgi:chorismate mutase
MSIENYRQKIDQIEDDLIRLISERAEYAKHIGSHKRELNLPIYDPKREDEILERIGQKNPGPLPAEDLQEIFRNLIKVTREFEARHQDDHE